MDQIIIQRDRTALRRSSCSAPLARALTDGVITKGVDVFDFGCGYGSDLRYLRSHRIQANGWDPCHRPKSKIIPADVVNLIYVLNVIENKTERHETLTHAFALAKRILIVAVRIEHTLDEADEFADGVVTSRGTFQKIYTQQEFREYLESVLQQRIHVAALGMAYVFKDAAAEASYVANRAFTRRLEYRPDLIAEFKRSKIARSYVSLVNRLGRLPLLHEFPKYPKLIEGFGSAKRIERLTLRHIDQKLFEGSRVQRREDILTYLAMLKLGNMVPSGVSKLPISVRSNLRALWKTYADALKESEQFLFKIGKPEVVAQACATCQAGKLLPFHLYVHHSVEDELPALLRVITFAGKEIVGELTYDLIKFATDGRAISFLKYQNFDEDPHPALLRSVKVYLPKATYGIREYLDSQNPPILHRKETFVLPSYPHFNTFRKLTQQEKALGLLSSSDIGYRRPWEELLQARQVRIENHNLYELTASTLKVDPCVED